ncbi:MauE/DoxX family redox-associated membrane protein [Chitinophaga sp. MM2321]|uniref:MauE/DoxX family redox-associated membrane protein n=1 Tax=Chitinophaga sp. MM2321 TaxID=3137178 RepID=UPI0032D57DDD
MFTINRRRIIEFIIYAFFFLFIYTSATKLLDFDLFLRDLNRSPELAPFKGILSVIIPGAELIIAGLILFKNTRQIGFIGAIAIMALFTIYVAYVLTLPDIDRPCSCGGIIRSLTWQQHIIFNLVFLLLAIVGYLLNRKPSDTTNWMPINT